MSPSSVQSAIVFPATSIAKWLYLVRSTFFVFFCLIFCITVCCFYAASSFSPVTNILLVIFCTHSAVKLTRCMVDGVNTKCEGCYKHDRKETQGITHGKTKKDYQEVSQISSLNLRQDVGTAFHILAHSAMTRTKNMINITHKLKSDLLWNLVKNVPNDNTITDLIELCASNDKFTFGVLYDAQGLEGLLKHLKDAVIAVVLRKADKDGSGFMVEVTDDYTFEKFGIRVNAMNKQSVLLVSFSQILS